MWCCKELPAMALYVRDGMGCSHCPEPLAGPLGRNVMHAFKSGCCLPRQGGDTPRKKRHVSLTLLLGLTSSMLHSQ